MYQQKYEMGQILSLQKKENGNIIERSNDSDVWLNCKKWVAIRQRAIESDSIQVGRLLFLVCFIRQNKQSSR